MSFFCPVIGIGAISSAGSGSSQGYRNILSGESFHTPLSLFEWKDDKKPLVGEILNLDQETDQSRTTTLATIAIEEAIEGINLSGLRVGLTVATTVGNIDRVEKELFSDSSKSSKLRGDYLQYQMGALTDVLAKKFEVDGFHTVSTACSSGIHAIGMARRLIELDQYDAVISVGADSLVKLTLNGFDSLLLIDPNGSRPFDRDRVGRSIGEAAGALLLMSEEASEKLRTKPICYISGWGASADAYHMTAPHPEGDGAKRAILEALEDAEINPEEIDWVLTHGTSTIDNDLSEINAMKSVFNTIPPFTSIKGAIGHTLAASGSVETVYAIEAIKSGEIPATYGFRNIDPDIGIAPAPNRKLPIKTVLKTAFGFGGNNGAVVISGEKI